MPAVSSRSNRTKVFISYSHKDIRDLERLHKHLTPYEQMGIVDTWDDTKIIPGAVWRQEIERAIENAKVAILLVSADFLASDFITKNELPALLVAAQTSGAIILSVILSPSGFETSSLAQFQAVNSPSRPLTRMNRNEKEETWKKVAKIVYDAIASQELLSTNNETLTQAIHREGASTDAITSLSKVDLVALSFFRESKLFSLFKPDEGVYSLPMDEEALELHWFQVRKEGASHGGKTGEYLDVFCISTFNRLPTEVRLDLRTRGFSWQTILSQYYDVLALTPSSIDQIAQRMLNHLSQEAFPISSEKFFLFVPRLPEAGVHLLTRYFDTALRKVIPIPFDMPTVEESQSQASCSKILEESYNNWSKRINRYLRVNPVTGPDYYRRDDLETQIQRYIDQGQPFGLFGLRRVGKTSMLFEMGRRLSFGHACVSVQKSQNYISRSIWTVFLAAMKDWIQALHRLKVEPEKLSLVEAHVLSQEHIDVEFLEEGVTRILHLLPEKMRLVLFLDDADEFLPSASGQYNRFPDWREFLAFLRMLFYDSEGRFVLGVAAFGSEIAYDTFGESSLNPWWRQIVPIVLRPFTHSECNQMVQDIGAMNAVYYTSDALDLLYEGTSGHPQVTRELCARLTEQVKDRPHVVQVYEMNEAIRQFVADPFSSIEAIYKSLSRQERAILIHLAREKQITSTELYQALKEEFTSLQDFNKTVMRMIQFGFLQKEEANSALYLSFGLFKRYLANG